MNFQSTRFIPFRCAPSRKRFGIIYCNRDYFAERDKDIWHVSNVRLRAHFVENGLLETLADTLERNALHDRVEKPFDNQALSVFLRNTA